MLMMMTKRRLVGALLAECVVLLFFSSFSGAVQFLK
jgi:hypothetical protein